MTQFWNKNTNKTDLEKKEKDSGDINRKNLKEKQSKTE